MLISFAGIRNEWLQKHNARHLCQGELGGPPPYASWTHYMYYVKGNAFIITVTPELGWNIYTSAIVTDWNCDPVWSVPATLKAVEDAWENDSQRPRGSSGGGNAVREAIPPQG